MSHVSHPLPPQARRGLSPTSRLTPPSLFWGKKMEKIHLRLSHLGDYLLVTLVSTEFWLFFSHIVDIFPPTVFLPPLSHQIIAKSTQFIYHREVEAPVRLSRRSHSDVYFYSQVYLTLKPQNNLFIYPAVAKVHNNTLREPLSLSMHWPVAFEGWSPRKEMTIMFRS